MRHSTTVQPTTAERLRARLATEQAERRSSGGGVSHLDLASFVLTRSPYDPTADVPGGVDPAGWHAPEA